MAEKQAMEHLSKQYEKACREGLRKSIHEGIDEFLGNGALSGAYKQEVLDTIASFLALHELQGNKKGGFHGQG